MITIATAGWSISRAAQTRFPAEGRHLERYAQVLPGVEIDSSFYRPHRNATYARWSRETPAGFRFAVKLPKTITHEGRLCDGDGPLDELLDRFLAEVDGLGAKLGVLLVQLPPSLAFDAQVVDAFFTTLRARHAGAVVCEPRHRSWFDRTADDLLVTHRIGRVAADPALLETAAHPGGWLGQDGSGCAYHRWHGSPRMYWSAYDGDWLARRAAEVLRWPEEHDVWCVFDNTAAGAAIDDALRFANILDGLETELNPALDLAAWRRPRWP